MKKEKYFIFLDETGNNNQENFFGIGIVIVPVEKIGYLYNILDKNCQKIKNISKVKMLERIKNHYIDGDFAQVLKYAESTNSFELKFKSINKENFALYSQLIKESFEIDGLFFSSIIFDKTEKGYFVDNISHWHRYLNNVALLIVNNMKLFSSNAEFVILADQISQPKSENTTYEHILTEKINFLLNKKNIPNKIFGITRIESHSAPLVQLADILIGAVAYDFYNNKNSRKEGFMQNLRDLMEVNSFGNNLTKNEPIYFSVWKFKQK